MPRYSIDEEEEAYDEYEQDYHDQRDYNDDDDDSWDSAVEHRRRSSTSSTGSTGGTFEEFFNNEGVKDIEALIGRNRFGRKFTESLIQYMALRVEAEQAYAKALKKLSDFQFPALEPIMAKALKPYGGYNRGFKENSVVHLSTIMNIIQKETKSFATAQANYVQKIEKGILEQFKSSFKKQVGTKLKHKARLFKASENITSTMSRIGSLRKDACKLKEKRVILKATLEVDPTNTKVQSEFEKVKNSVQTADAKVKDAERSLDSQRKDLRAGIHQAAFDIHETEMTRLQLAYEKFDELCGLMRDQLKITNRFSDSVIEALSRADPEAELEDFAQKYAGRQSIPVE